MTAAHMIEDETPIPDHVQAAIHWPHQTPTCVHYDPPIKLDPPPREPPDQATMQGVIILPASDGSTAVIITLGTTEGTPDVTTDTIDTTKQGILESDESQRITRYYIRLARHITRSLQSSATQPNRSRQESRHLPGEAPRAAGTQTPNGRADQHRRTTTTPFRRRRRGKPLDTRHRGRGQQLHLTHQRTWC